MNEVAKNLMCIQMRSGVELWAEKERVAQLQGVLRELKSHIFVNYDEQTVNTADIVGIFTAETMASNTKRKNGEWQCKYGEWHDKFEKCTDECKINSLLNKSL